MLCVKIGWNCLSGYMYICYRIHLEKKTPRNELFSHKEVLWQIWLKLIEWLLRRRWKCEKFTSTNGQTNDWQHAIRKAHNNFQLRWAKQFGKIYTYKIKQLQNCTTVGISHRKSYSSAFSTCINTQETHWRKRQRTAANPTCSLRRNL